MSVIKSQILRFMVSSKHEKLNILINKTCFFSLNKEKSFTKNHKGYDMVENIISRGDNLLSIYLFS